MYSSDRGAGGGIDTTEGGGDVSHTVAVVGGAVWGRKLGETHTQIVCLGVRVHSLALAAADRREAV